MTLKPPAPGPLTSNWDLEDDGAGATREVDPDELFARAGLIPGARAAPGRSGGQDSTLPSPSSAAVTRPSIQGEDRAAVGAKVTPAPGAELLALGDDFGDDFRALTPWAASALGDREPASLSALFEESLAATLEQPSEDLGAAGSGALSEVDFSDIMPVITPRRRGRTVPPQSVVDELDMLLSDEALQATRPATGSSPSAVREIAEGESSALDLEFDDPSFVAPPGDLEALASASGVDLGSIDATFSGPSSSPLDLDERTAIELPDDPALSPEALGALGIEMSPDTMLEAAFPQEAPIAVSEGSIQARLERLRARFEVGDYSGALVIAEGMLDEAPRHLAARCYAESCRAMLQQMYQTRIGDRSKALRIIMAPAQLRSLSLDHRAGFLLSCVDGVSTIDDILDISGMQPLDALRILFDLFQQGVVDVEAPPSGAR